ncbi:aldo-keto reductase AKR2E4-like [Leptidea sinapis]|uniref:aldo-keto reductase AKR2E4-like n=1 Tax=Leptidea sinapis TaxID=189913 RepID=UPI0021242F56|nr:aldo-keto reductase AKR2E4-like [Leptidea sinapis]
MLSRALVGFALLLHVNCKLAPVVTLNDGNLMPAFGLGTWLGTTPSGSLAPVENDEVQRAVEVAIDAGYRHIDTAAIYSTEEQVGLAVRNKIKQGVIKREDIFITTKLWNDHHAREDVPKGLDSSLRKLGMEYVDLYLIHFPIGTYPNMTDDHTDYLDTWRSMIELKERGLTRSVGVSNFNVAMLERLTAETGVVPAVLQVEISLTIQQPSLLAYCRAHNISVVGYTPFGTLFLHNKTAPPPRVDSPELVAIAQRHNKTVPQIVLRYVYELGVTPIPKSVKKSRIEQNLDIFDFELSEEERQQLSSYDQNYRSLDLSLWKHHPYYPFEQ